MAYGVQAKWCQLFFTWEHRLCATMGNARSDVNIR
jgi:hypothetical protein